jgi:hypothetical protein
MINTRTLRDGEKGAFFVGEEFEEGGKGEEWGLDKGRPAVNWPRLGSSFWGDVRDEVVMMNERKRARNGDACDGTERWRWSVLTDQLG